MKTETYTHTRLDKDDFELEFIYDTKSEALQVKIEVRGDEALFKTCTLIFGTDETARLKALLNKEK